MTISRDRMSKTESQPKLLWCRPEAGTVKSKCGRVIITRCDVIPPNPEGWVIYIDRRPVGKEDGGGVTMGEAKIKANELIRKQDAKATVPGPTFIGLKDVPDEHQTPFKALIQLGTGWGGWVRPIELARDTKYPGLSEKRFKDAGTWLGDRVFVYGHGDSLGIKFQKNRFYEIDSLDMMILQGKMKREP